MTDEQKQKLKDYQKEYYAKKLNKSYFIAYKTRD